MSDLRKTDEKKMVSGKVAYSPSSSLGGMPEVIPAGAMQATTGPRSFATRRLVAVPPPSMKPCAYSSLSPPSFMRCHTPEDPSSMTRGEGAKSTVGSVSTCSSWNVTDDLLPILPDFYPLERTAVFVPHTSAIVVARRVSDILQSRSVVTTFTNGGSKAKAKCITEDNVDFRVRLYRRKGPKFSHGVIVEVQRRFGFHVSYHPLVLAILDAAEGKTPTEPLSSLLAPEAPHALVSDDDDDGERTPDRSSLTKRRKSHSSLSIASEMLKKARKIDSQVLALESLAALTDSKKVGPATAKRISNQLFSEGMDDVWGASEVRDNIVAFLLNARLPGDANRGKQVAIASNNALAQNDKATLCLLAITVLTNACISASFISFDMASYLLSIFLLKVSSTNPRYAYLAVCGLTALMKGDPRLINMAAVPSTLEKLSGAHELGRMSYAHLADAARECGELLER